MTVSSPNHREVIRPPSTSTAPVVDDRPDRQFLRWGAVAGLGGAAAMVGAGVVVGVMDLPDASDVETLRDFTDIESGRIAEHFFYLGAVALFALHLLVLHALVAPAHRAAALFGTALAQMGLVIMAASSLLHVSTSPLAELTSESGTTDVDERAIEYAWHGAQSVWDTMLATGVLLVPIGLFLLGMAMRASEAFGRRAAMTAMALGSIGTIGATIAVIDPGSMFSALAVLAIAVFHVVTGWRLWVMSR